MRIMYRMAVLFVCSTNYYRRYYSAAAHMREAVGFQLRHERNIGENIRDDRVARGCIVVRLGQGDVQGSHSSVRGMLSTFFQPKLSIILSGAILSARTHPITREKPN